MAPKSSFEPVQEILIFIALSNDNMAHVNLCKCADSPISQGQIQELCWICWPNHEINHELRDRAINWNDTDGL